MSEPKIEACPSCNVDHGYIHHDQARSVYQVRCGRARGPEGGVMGVLDDKPGDSDLMAAIKGSLRAKLDTEHLDLVATAGERIADLEAQLAQERAEKEELLTALRRLAAARKAHLDAVAAYNARVKLSNSERDRGNWSVDCTLEFKAMGNTGSVFARVAQDVADAALNPKPEGGPS